MYKLGAMGTCRRARSAAAPARSYLAAHAGLLWALVCAGCSSSEAPDRYDPKLGVSSSPRVVTAPGPVAKGGGVFKVGNPYQVGGRWYYPSHDPGYNEVGVASWYGPGFHGRKTANGEIFDQYALTAAHKTLPLPSYAYVTNLENGRTVLVRINDRGPYVNDRIIDLSKASADALGYKGAGLSRVRVRYAGQAPLDGNDRREQQFLASQTWRSQPNFADARAPFADSYQPREPVFAPQPRTAYGPQWSPFSHRAGYGARSGLGAANN